MIDVSPYINKLEVLKEYMALRIDRPRMWLLDMGSLPWLSWEEVMRIYDQTGFYYYNSQPPSVKELTSKIKDNG
jgi:hypothetical protein